MSEGLDLAELSMINDMARMRVISQNLANVSTTGYRADTAVTTQFEPQLLQAQTDLLTGPRDSLTPRIETYTSHDAGTYRNTGNPLDVALEGDAFFVIDTGQGEAYSRDGAFQLDGAGRLVNATGLPVMSTNGDLRVGTSTPRIDKQGNVFDGDELLGQLKLVRFANPEKLVKAGRGYFLPEPGQLSMAIEEDDQALVRQSYVENSNVQMSTEVVQMMDVLQHFKSSQNVLRSYDQMLDTAISTIAEF
jgi:flagellar basal-body rod protein FlgF